ncbi:hypothetical protein ACIQ4Z_10910 [Peribacillus asahii]
MTNIVLHLGISCLNDINYGVVLLWWNTKNPMEPEQMRCFLSTDTELTT